MTTDLQSAAAPPVAPPVPPSVFGQASLSISSSANTRSASLVVQNSQATQMVGSALGTWMSRRYSEAVGLARIKVLGLAGLFALLAGGLTVKASGSSLSASPLLFDFIMAPPGVAEVLCGQGALAFAVGMDVYTMRRRSQDEKYYWTLACDPSLDPVARDALLERLRRP